MRSSRPVGWRLGQGCVTLGPFPHQPLLSAGCFYFHSAICFCLCAGEGVGSHPPLTAVAEPLTSAAAPTLLWMLSPVSPLYVPPHWRSIEITSVCHQTSNSLWGLQELDSGCQACMANFFQPAEPPPLRLVLLSSAELTYNCHLKDGTWPYTQA